MTLTLADSGKGRADVTLNAVAEMALDLGFEKQGGAADAQKKASQRADLKRFFQTYGVNALTPFKEKFAKEKLLPPEEHVAAAKEASEKEAEKDTFAPVTKEAYAEAVEEYESLARKWKLFKKCVFRGGRSRLSPGRGADAVGRRRVPRRLFSPRR